MVGNDDQIYFGTKSSSVNSNLQAQTLMRYYPDDSGKLLVHHTAAGFVPNSTSRYLGRLGIVRNCLAYFR